MKKLILIFTFIVGALVTNAQTKSYTFVFLNNKPDKEVLSKEKSDSIMTGHLANIGLLAKEGKLLTAGPFEGGGGIFILNTTSIDEANKWLSTDPGIKAKRWNLEVLPYTVRAGSICPIGENYEMVFYLFFRFTPSGSIASEEFKRHNENLEKLRSNGLVISEGTFDDKGNGILILKADGAQETIEAELKSGLLKFEMKKLYVAKGSFCEK